MPTSNPIRILYMEDNPGEARLLQKKLERAGYKVDIARDGEEGLAMYEAAPYEVVVVDQNMPIHPGLEVIRLLAARGPLPPTLMVTGAGDEQIAVEAMKLGASDYLVKDVRGGYLKLLPAVIEQALAQRRLVEEKQQMETALRQSMAELQARNEELNAFAHTVAHDLQNLLTRVIGFADVLTEQSTTGLDEKFPHYLQLIAQNGRKMSNIINELLVLTSVRKLKVEPKPLDMAGIVAEAQQRLADMIEAYQAQIRLPDSWPVALGHEPWVEEVWANYLSNAIKYGGRPPQVELGATLLADGWIRFWIADNGAGLTPEEQAQLFTPFTRLDVLRVEGYGLGLSIVRRIIEKLGGQVGVESEGVAGRGSVFSFTLPGSNDR